MFETDDRTTDLMQTMFNMYSLSPNDQQSYV